MVNLISELVGLIIVTVILICQQNAAVIPRRLNELTRQDLLKLDNEVSNYFVEDYDSIDRRNVSYDDILFKSIRAIRHTVVIEQFDFKYTDRETMKKSAGPKVDVKLCKDQLKLLIKFAQIHKESYGHLKLPLSVINLLESSGRTESGILNGNFVWLGSYSSCIRAKIPGRVLSRYFPPDEQAGDNNNNNQTDLNGRYCVAHLRAKKWPKWDIYFEDRITIRKAVCLPDTCHSIHFAEDEEIQTLVDQLNRYNLLEPFNDDDRYETSDLYCLPDEDSEFRELDLGAKLFLAFVAFWVLISMYANYKYNQRTDTLKKLRESVDIKMIINEKRDDDGDNANDEANQDSDSDEANRKVAKKRGSRSSKSHTRQDLAPGDGQLAPQSANPSANATPQPSDIEDDCDFKEPLLKMNSKPGGGSDRQEGRTKTKAPNKSYNFDQTNNRASSGLDLVEAFSIEANLNYLFSARPNMVRRDNDMNQQSSVSSTATSPSNKRHSQQQLVAAVSRRISSSNEALIKDLKGEQGADGVGGSADHQRRSKVAIISGKDNTERDQDSMRSRRVNIDILDGVKVVATCYIIHGHTLMFFFGLVKDLRFASERMLDLTMLATINTLQVVGLFYIITGCLLTYLAFNKGKRKQILSPIFWILVLINRYARLLPSYLIVFWFARHMSPYTGFGSQFLEYRTDESHARGFCAKESWWTMWTMSAADVKIPMDCIPQAWYISNDFRTLIVLPVYIFILAKNAKAGYVAILSTFVLSIYRMVTTLNTANIDYQIVLHWKPHVYSLMADRLHDVYTDFYVRVSTYLLGVILGHLLYLYETRRIKQWPDWLRKYGMPVSFFVGTSFFLGAKIISNPFINQFMPAREDVNSHHVVLLIPLFKTAMELCQFTVTLLLLTGNGYKWVRDILSSRTMKILSNISYTVFLTHVEIMYKLPSSLFEANYWNLFIFSCFFIVLSHIVSFILYTFYEMPINNVLRYVFKRAYSCISG